LAHSNLLQLVSHHDTDSVKDLGMFCRNKMPGVCRPPVYTFSAIIQVVPRLGNVEPDPDTN